jgi:hypothetical protein
LALFPFSDAFAADEYDENSLANQFDWVMYLDEAFFEKFLNYPTSGLASLHKFSASYQHTASSYLARGIRAPEFKRNNYEEFWYHEGRVIGQQRFCGTPTPASEQGAIIFRHREKNEPGDKFRTACTNCLVRLFLEARLNQSIVSAIIVPTDQFEKIATELAVLNFLPVQSDTKQADGNLTLRLLSYPAGYDRHFYYADHRPKQTF